MSTNTNPDPGAIPAELAERAGRCGIYPDGEGWRYASGRWAAWPPAASESVWWWAEDSRLAPGAPVAFAVRALTAACDWLEAQRPAQPEPMTPATLAVFSDLCERARNRGWTRGPRPDGCGFAWVTPGGRAVAWTIGESDDATGAWWWFPPNLPAGVGHEVASETAALEALLAWRAPSAPAFDPTPEGYQRVHANARRPLASASPTAPATTAQAHEAPAAKDAAGRHGEGHAFGAAPESPRACAVRGCWASRGSPSAEAPCPTPAGTAMHTDADDLAAPGAPAFVPLAAATETADGLRARIAELERDLAHATQREADRDAASVRIRDLCERAGLSGVRLSEDVAALIEQRDNAREACVRLRREREEVTARLTATDEALEAERAKGRERDRRLAIVRLAVAGGS
jgi:hypothetical protein